MGRSDQRHQQTIAKTVMLIPDFSKYSLALFEGGALIHASNGKGVRPLFEALEKFRAKSGLILHDKIIGLAAAKLVVYSGIIAKVNTTVASAPADKFLKDHGILMNAAGITANILTQDKRAVCPGEVIALKTKDPADFIRQIKTMLDNQRE